MNEEVIHPLTLLGVTNIRSLGCVSLLYCSLIGNVCKITCTCSEFSAAVFSCSSTCL